MKLRRLAIAAVAVGVLAGVSGCGDKNETSDDTGGTSKQSAPAVLTQDEFAGEVSSAQAQSDSAHIEMSIDVQGEAFEGSGDAAGLGDPDDLTMQFEATFAGEDLEMRVIDKAIYLKSAMLAQDGKEWTKIDTTDPSSPLSQIFESANPSNFTAYLEGISAFEDKGTATVEGVETRHYEVTVETAAMLAKNPMFEGMDASTLGLPKEIVVQAFVDSANRPVKLEVGLGDAGTFEATFTDYGKDVSVEAPDASTVGEFSF